jgi:hypothetical protein
MVAERVCALCKMFLDAGVINSEYAIDKIGLKPKSSISTEFPTHPQIRTVYVPYESNNYELTRAHETIEEQKKELEHERIIDRELLRFIKYYPHIKINEDEAPWTRARTEHPVVEIYFELLTKKPKKTKAQRMLELDPKEVESLFNSIFQERHFEPI